MKGLGDILLALFGQFAVLSLLAFGGANSVVPEMHRQAVTAHHWMTDAEFTALFAIAQAAPGPNFMVSTLVGWKAAGLAGAAVATAAMCAPSCILTFAVAKAWDRYRDAPWRRAIAAGLAPVTVGMVTATGWLLLRAADANWRLALVSLGVATVVSFTRLNPLWALAAGAAVGLLGLI